MEHGSNSLDLTLPGMHVNMNSNYASMKQNNLAQLMVSDSEIYTAMNSCNTVTMAYTESLGSNAGSIKSGVWVPNKLDYGVANLIDASVGGMMALPMKKHTEIGHLFDSSISQQFLLSNKPPLPVSVDVITPGFVQTLVSQRKTAAFPSKLGSPGQRDLPSMNKKVVQSEANSGKSMLQLVHTSKKQTSQVESARKTLSGSSEAVRSKMRESLASVLVSMTQNCDDSSVSAKNQDDAPITNHCEASKASESNSTMGISGTEEVLASKQSAEIENSTDLSPRVLNTEISGNVGLAFPEFRFDSSFPVDIAFGDNFIAKDDLLQGNDLSWAYDFDLLAREGSDPKDAEDPRSLKDKALTHRAEVPKLAPEIIALKIETELHKLFGGVNKKYREKGRSLLFNLKDPNNPELRERVMSGEILPRKLCSMSAEELASKKLTEWRMAKAEEFAQMVVLPDTEVDIRRLVRKTHKGEYQVEVEVEHDGIAAEVSGGTSILTQTQPKEDKSKKIPVEDEERSAGLVIATDGTDPMQGMVVDELKEVENLPPVVSLDDFMESLDSEPPFQNLSAARGDHVNSAAVVPTAHSLKSNSSEKTLVIINKHGEDVMVNSHGSSANQQVLPSTESKLKYVWDGTLQLNTSSSSSSVAIGGLYQSGEKVSSTEEWPTSLEIKGRVKLEAFTKFIRELPMSRSRAVMVLHFVLKDGSSEEVKSNFSEAINSYSADERIGYAEPIRGLVELYLCPPTPKTTKLLMNEGLLDLQIENGLIGVVVWRRPAAHLSNTKKSPTLSSSSSSHYKHSLKKLHPTSSKRARVSFHNVPRPEPKVDDDVDIPPGFGPGTTNGAGEDDDLPEFSFSAAVSGSVNPIRSQGPVVDHARELIKKYGQNEDDEDIPEWKPQQFLRHWR